MEPRNPLFAALIAVLAATAPTAAQAGMTEDVKAINDGWAHISYEVHGSSTQTVALDRLAVQAEALVRRYPNQAEPLLWQGIVVSEQANRANIFHKLGLATRARDIIAHAYALNPRAGNGGAAMSLGVLYYKVPGSPIGFGDKDRANRLLREAVGLNPNGLDANYFYGDFLLDQGDKAGARAYLQKALRAPSDPTRPAWDAGRRREVQALLAQAR
ncbi:hypothetical protein GCM10011614_33400 [Novosphingobium colocasiae]|uniref:Tetratricopeptide repeat protein n=2 Tax=Novosphingobium colocasiae TaxID=1256513 RepID=A0A918PMF1_9SPHN|nr:hypothetical protein GCM10011614_33400 [Novosphingobium colocasiae]